MEPLSASQLGTYLGCSLKYRFQYVDRIPRPWRAAAMAFGTSVHAGVEYFQKERLAGRSPEPQAVLAQFDADWYAQNVEPLVFSRDDSQESLREKGHELLMLYVAEQSPTLPQVVEHAFELELVDPESGEILGFHLRGILDLVEEGDTLVELKTAARTLEPGGLERHLQLSVYALAYFLLYDRIPKLRIDLLLKTKVGRLEHHATSRTLEDLAWTARLVERTGRAIEAGHFFPNPTWRCMECEYFAHCQGWRG